MREVRPYLNVASLRAARIAVVVYGAGIVLYLSTPFLGSAALAWATAACMGLAGLVEWGTWLRARDSLAEMPLFGHGRIPAADASQLGPVVVIAAARNEESGVERAVRSMATQDYPSLQLIVVDDHSTDATAEILDRLASEIPNLRVIHNPPLQAGWLGKQNAFWCAAQQPGPEPCWLLFTDADIVFGPTVLREAVAFAEGNGTDFLTCIPWLEPNSMVEGLVLGANWARILEQCPNRKRNQRRTRPIGIGAFMLVRRQAYFERGGHARIADHPIDDTALAALMSDSGAKVDVGRAGDQLRCRQYEGFRDMLCGLVRKQRTILGDSVPQILVQMEYQFLQFVLPLPLALAGIAAQVYSGAFHWGLSAFSLAAAVLYLQGMLSLAQARAICPMRRMALFLAPALGLLRIYTSLRALWAGLTDEPIEWRGRKVQI